MTALATELAATMRTPLLETRGLSKHYALQRSTRAWFKREPGEVLRAVDDVSLSVMPGRTLGVVGETGSGKSTLGRLVLRLERPSSGQVLLDGKDVASGGGAMSHRLRRDVQVVLQDPYTSLNPHETVGAALAEVLKVTGTVPAAERPARVAELLDQVGFPSGWAGRKPGQLSGGGRQRVSIARALAVGPRLLVADEPVSALDVSVQAQVLNLFQRLQSELGLAYLFITTTSRCWSGSPTTSPCSTSAASSSPGRPRRSSPARRTPTRRRCSPPPPSSAAVARPPARSPASCRTRSPRPRAAPSTPGARPP